MQLDTQLVDNREDIFQIIRREIDDYIFNQIEIVEGYTFSTYWTIKRCHLYYNSQFQNKSLYNGRERLFFNVVKSVCLLASRSLDLDTKDIKLYPLNPESEIGTFLLEKELKLWLKEKKVNKILKQITDEAPIYGSVVLKKTPKGGSVVDLRRFFLDPTVETVQKSRFVTQKHYLTVSELRAKVKDGWDSEAIERVIKRHREKSTAPQAYERSGQVNQIVSSPYIEVFERYGEVERQVYDNSDSKDIIKTLFIVTMPDNYSSKGQTQGQDVKVDGEILFKSQWLKDWPYKDYHYSKTRGRWLGVGVIEDLFPIQERINEMANQKRIAMEVGSMLLFQTKDKTVVSNILTDLESGDILQTSDIDPVATELRSLEAFGQEEERYDELAKSITFSFDTLRGETLPASTPATNAVLQNQNAQSIFEYKREQLGIMLTDYFNELVLPQCLKELTPQHILNFLGTVEELNKLDDIAAESYANNEALNAYLTGKVFTEQDKQLAKQKALDTYKKQGNKRFVDIKEGFYKDLEFEFDIMVTGEQENVTVMAQNIFQILQTLGQNPGLLNDPVTKAFLVSYAEKIGIDPIKIELAANDRQQQLAQQPQLQQPVVSPLQQNLPVKSNVNA